MSLPRDLIEQQPVLGEWSILTCYRGSIAHGTYIAPKEPTGIDDKDVMALCVPPTEYYIGLKIFGSRGTAEIVRDEWDIVVYEIKKALSLLAQGNPNILQILWLEDRHYIDVKPAGELLLSNRDLFIGKHVFKPFAGYARAQFEKMRRVRFHGRMGEKRKTLVRKFGYDTKNAAHMIRLLRMGIEFLSTGELQVERPDASEIVGIKSGYWSLEEVEAEAARLFSAIDNALIHSKLPDKPDRDRISDLCQEIVMAEWMRRNSLSRSQFRRLMAQGAFTKIQTH